jgi:hypothetical protein
MPRVCRGIRSLKARLQLFPAPNIKGSRNQYSLCLKQERIMQQNMGTTDRIIRVIVAALFAYLYFGGVVTGALGIILLVLAVVFLATSALAFCPLYMPFKFSTRK